jgi:hypothetical protein
MDAICPRRSISDRARKAASACSTAVDIQHRDGHARWLAQVDDQNDERQHGTDGRDQSVPPFRRAEGHGGSLYACFGSRLARPRRVARWIRS